MLPNPSFSSWLGRLFGHSDRDIQRLLNNETALHFLIAWSLFESKCFEGFVKAKDIEKFSQTACSSIDWQVLNAITEHFHARYQCPNLFANLMHGQVDLKLRNLLRKSVNQFSCADHLYFLVFVIYRYRNNIFHGNKGVQSWLQYQEQIQYCIHAMQVLVSYSESRVPTMNVTIA